MKKLLSLLLFPLVVLAQTNVQKDTNKKLSNGSLVVGDNTSITATGTGVIAATSVPSIAINTTAPLTGGGALSGNLTLAIPAATGSVNGYLTSTDWTTFNSKAAPGNYITALTGDGSAAGPGSVALTLATVNGNVGTFGNSTTIPQITVNGKGLITAVTNVNVTGLPDQTGNSGKFLTTNGTSASWSSNLVTSITGTANQITASASNGAVTLSLPTTIANVNSITSATSNPLTLSGISGASLILGNTASGFAKLATGTSAIASYAASSNLLFANYTAGVGSINGLAILMPTNHNSGAPWAISSTTVTFGGPTIENDAVLDIGFNTYNGGNKIVAGTGIGAGRKYYFQMEHDFYQQTGSPGNRLDEWHLNGERDDGSGIRLFQSSFTPAGAGTHLFNLWGEFSIQDAGLNTGAVNYKANNFFSDHIEMGQAFGTATPGGYITFAKANGAFGPVIGLNSRDQWSWSTPFCFNNTSVWVDSNLDNSSARPATSATPIAGEYWGFSRQTPTNVDGFVRFSAGGGSGGGATKSYIDVTGFSTVADMDRAIVFFPGATETGRFNLAGFQLTAGAMIGGANSMTITAGSGNSRTLTLQSTTSGGTATPFLVGNADQSVSLAGGVASTSTATGTLKITGGEGISGALWVGGLANVASTLSVGAGTIGSQKFLVSDGALTSSNYALIYKSTGPAQLKISDNTQADGSVILGDYNSSAANVGIYRGTIAGTYGGGNALNLGGYAGVAVTTGNAAFGSQTVAATFDTTQNFKVFGTTDAFASSTDASIHVLGGAAVAKALWVGGLTNVAGVLTAANATAATSTSSGGLVVTGGAGIGGALYVGGVLNVTNTNGNTNGSNSFPLSTTFTPPNPAGDLYGLRVTAATNSGGASGSTVHYIRADGQNTGTTNTADVVMFDAAGGKNAASGTISNITGFKSQPALQGASTVTTYRHFHATNVFNPSGTVVNQVAVDVDALTSANTSYAFRSNGAGLFVVGDTTDASNSTTASVTMAGGLGVAKKTYHGDDVHNSGNYYTDASGKTLLVKSGTNAAAGTVTLVAGAATITSTAIDANTVIVFSEKTSGGTPGVYQPLAAVTSGSATVTSAATDTSTYNWVAVKVN